MSYTIIRHGRHPAELLERLMFNGDSISTYLYWTDTRVKILVHIDTGEGKYSNSEQVIYSYTAMPCSPITELKRLYNSQIFKHAQFKCFKECFISLHGALESYV